MNFMPYVWTLLSPTKRVQSQLTMLQRSLLKMVAFYINTRHYVISRDAPSWQTIYMPVLNQHMNQLFLYKSMDLEQREDSQRKEKKKKHRHSRSESRKQKRQKERGGSREHKKKDKDKKKHKSRSKDREERRDNREDKREKDRDQRKDKDKDDKQRKDKDDKQRKDKDDKQRKDKDKEEKDRRDKSREDRKDKEQEKPKEKERQKSRQRKDRDEKVREKSRKRERSRSIKRRTERSRSRDKKRSYNDRDNRRGNDRTREDKYERWRKEAQFRFDSPPKSDESDMSDDPEKMDKLNKMKAEKELVTSKADRKLYLGNLPPNITSNQLMQMLNSALKKMEINCEEEGDSIVSAWISPDGVGHYAFVEFRTAQEATAGLALNGASLYGYQLKLGRPKQYIEYHKQLLSEFGSDGNIDTILRKVQAMGGFLEPPRIEERLVYPPSRVVVLKHIVTVEELAIDEQYNEIVEDVSEVAKRHGDVLKVVIPRPMEIDLAEVKTRVKGLGYIFIKYRTVQQAKYARKEFIKQMFSERSVNCGFFPEKKLQEGDLDVLDKVIIDF